MKILEAVNASLAAVVKEKPDTSLSLYSYVRHPNRTRLPTRSLDRRERGSMHRMLCETFKPIEPKKLYSDYLSLS